MTKQEAQTLRAAVFQLVVAEVKSALIERERDLASEEYEMLLDALTEESNHA